MLHKFETVSSFIDYQITTPLLSTTSMMEESAIPPSETVSETLNSHHSNPSLTSDERDSVTDLESGEAAPKPSQRHFVQVVSEQESMPMNAFKRKGQELRRMAHLAKMMKPEQQSAPAQIEIQAQDQGEKEGINEEKISRRHSVTHYRLRARRETRPTNAVSRFLSKLGCKFNYDLAETTENQWLYSYLFWSFRTSFLMLFLSSLFFFFSLILIFAGLMVIVGVRRPECFSPAFDNDEGMGFSLAFALSWTTFSTVGYGSVFPVLDDQKICGGLSFLASMESFVGVLYAGFCGAILFGKVLRIQSSAQVQFSDPVVVRYGNGVTEDDDLEEGENIPCPVLEFRLVNKLYNQLGGEIMDATMNCVAINVSTTGKVTKETRKSMLKKSKDAKKGSVTKLNDSVTGSKRVFAKVEIESAEHPFFRRVWIGRHVLDASSPLLTSHARKLIRRNNGFWPSELNTYQGVRDSLQFNQIAVSLAGVSNVSAASVYAQKIYDFVDINVGYQFANVLYRDENDNVLVDMGLVNDVLEQNGGGGEPLIDI